MLALMTQPSRNFAGRKPYFFLDFTCERRIWHEAGLGACDIDRRHRAPTMIEDWSRARADAALEIARAPGNASLTIGGDLRDEPIQCGRGLLGMAAQRSVLVKPSQLGLGQPGQQGAADRCGVGW